MTASKEQLAALAAAVNAFALDLYRTVASEKGNLFFSPWSIAVAFAMTHAGARGETARELERAFHFPRQALDASFRTMLDNLASSQARYVKLETANRLFAQKGYPILARFKETLERFYRAVCEVVDFAGDPEGARRGINRWVADATNGRIRELLGRGTIKPLTRLVLVNTIFFKGTWDRTFDERRTAKLPFYVSPTKKKQVATMHDTRRVGYAEGADYQAVWLPYKGRQIAMVILLPKRRDGLADLERRLGRQMLQGILDKLKSEKVEIWLPRFHVEKKLNLVPLLEALGVRSAFDVNRADFTGITAKKPGLYVSAAVHQANCDVDEKGTVAAAATAVVIATKAIDMSRPRVFRADHPFLFLIRHEPTGTVLFMGRVVEP